MTHDPQMKRTSSAQELHNLTEEWFKSEGLPLTDDMWDRLYFVDRLLSDAPMIDAPANFTDKVMAAIIASQDIDSTPHLRGGAGSSKLNGKLKSWRRRLFGFVLAISLLCLALVLSRTDVVYGVLQWAVLTLNQMGVQFAWLWRQVAHIAPTPILTTLLLSCTAGLLGLWWVALSVARRPRVVYHIPVNFH